MKVEELIIYGRKYLHSSDVNILLSSVLNINTLELFTCLDKVVSDEDVSKYKKMIEARLNNYPVQYITGNVNFYGYDFIVEPGVLIPRFDTEQLVYYVSNFIKEKFDYSLNIIDLCCGSGIIGITLSKLFPNSTINCLDIDGKALEVTNKNALKHKADINIINGDVKQKIIGKFDVVVSNPPYISYDDNEIEDIVKNNEPALALFAKNNGLEFYDCIIRNIKESLNDRFLIAFEIGYKQADEVINIAKKYLDNINYNVYKDLSGKDRVVLISNF